MKRPNSKFGIIRNALNCTQDQLATYLGLSRSFLANIERKHRILSGDAEARLLALYQLVLAEPVTAEPISEPVENDIHELQMDWQQQVERQRRVVDRMANTRQGALNTLAFTSKIRQTLPLDPRLDIFLRMLVAESQAVISKTTVNKIALQRLKLQALEAGLAAVSGKP